MGLLVAPTVSALLACLVLGTYASLAQAAGLHTDVALTPPKGGTILRVQLRHRRLRDDPTRLEGRDARNLRRRLALEREHVFRDPRVQPFARRFGVA